MRYKRALPDKCWQYCLYLSFIILLISCQGETETVESQFKKGQLDMPNMNNSLKGVFSQFEKQIESTCRVENFEFMGNFYYPSEKNNIA